MEENNNVSITTEKEGIKLGWGVLGFFFPIIGLILFFVWKNNKKNASKASGIGALVGFIIGLISTILFFVLGLGTLIGIGSTLESNENNGNNVVIPSTTENNSVDNQESKGIAFVNKDGAYYTYEGKSFIGTGVDNVLLSESIIAESSYSNAEHFYYEDPTEIAKTIETQAIDIAKAYCTNCRLMTKEEASSWGCPPGSPTIDANDKCKIEYNGSDIGWWLSDIEIITPEETNSSSYSLDADKVEFGRIYKAYISDIGGVRPAVSISTSATMTGTGTQEDPYVINK